MFDFSICAKRHFCERVALVECVSVDLHFAIRKRYIFECRRVVERLLSDNSDTASNINARKSGTIAKRTLAYRQQVVVNGYTFKIIASCEAIFGDKRALIVDIHARKSRLCKHRIRKLRRLVKHHARKRRAVLKRFFARIAQRREVCARKRRAIFECVCAYTQNACEIDICKCFAVLERGRADNFHLALGEVVALNHRAVLFDDVDGFEFLIAVECKFTYKFDRIGYRHRFKSRAVVEGVFLDFLNALGDNHARNARVGSGDFVGVVIVLFKFHGVVRFVQAECKRAYVQNAFVVGDNYVSAKPLIRNEFTIFNDEFVLDSYGNRRLNVGVLRFYRNDCRAFFECGHFTLFVDLRDIGVV